MTSLQNHVGSTIISDPHALAAPMAGALARSLEVPWSGALQHVVPEAVRARLTAGGT